MEWLKRFRGQTKMKTAFYCRSSSGIPLPLLYLPLTPAWLKKLGLLTFLYSNISFHSPKRTHGRQIITHFVKCTWEWSHFCLGFPHKQRFRQRNVCFKSKLTSGRNCLPQAAVLEDMWTRLFPFPAFSKLFTEINTILITRYEC